MECENEKGVYLIESVPDINAHLFSDAENNEDISFYYFGDPMCSWCWEACVKKTASASALSLAGYGPGGTWGPELTEFLRNEWAYIALKTRKPFSYRLLDRNFFNYDTKPACRVVVTAGLILGENKTLPFFRSIQEKFFVSGEGPKEKEFYRSLCDLHSIPFEGFFSWFESNEIKSATQVQFRFCRISGVQKFPKVCFRRNGRLNTFINGYLPPENLEGLFNNIVLGPDGAGKST
ncbi:hypothetical protein [Serratia quinivorans]|uniref:hypothetical protein n=1 Tax=Serratia quinivorans TaxID=137545 RepID=UPI002177C9C8|nr:hypothetical protein [Serratia quinivorans]CAI1959394.1 Uncharacterised protein [Serratia quinivorans]CAI2160683.1 Uncharacterised protein [Serratia quinivorans]